MKWSSPHWTVEAMEGNFQSWNHDVVRERARQSLERLMEKKTYAPDPKPVKKPKKGKK